MRSFAREHGVDLPNWTFLSGIIQKPWTAWQPCESDFTIIPSAGGFDHMAQVTFVDKAGQDLSAPIYGGSFSTPAVVEPLKDLVFDRTKHGRCHFPGLRSGSSGSAQSTIRIPADTISTTPCFIGIAIGIACLLLVLSWLLREYLPD